MAGLVITRNGIGRAVTSRECEHLLGVNLEQRCFRDRADWVHPFRFVEPEPAALSARDDQRRDLAATEGLLAEPDLLVRGVRRRDRQRSDRAALYRLPIADRTFARFEQLREVDAPRVAASELRLARPADSFSQPGKT